MSNLDKINLPANPKESGSLHPINQTKDYLLKILSGDALLIKDVLIETQRSLLLSLIRYWKNVWFTKFQYFSRIYGIFLK